jgi:hypothetical protein
MSRIIKTSGCLGDQIVNLRVGKIVLSPVVRFESNISSRVRTVVAVASVVGVSDKTHPAEVMAAFST